VENPYFWCGEFSLFCKILSGKNLGEPPFPVENVVFHHFWSIKRKKKKTAETSEAQHSWVSLYQCNGSLKSGSSRQFPGKTNGAEYVVGRC
jgi:hypothetical protein